MTREETLKVISDNLNRFNYSKRLFKTHITNSQGIVNEALTRKKAESNLLLRDLGGFSKWERKKLLSN